MTATPWHLLVPGGLEVVTGGTLYDRRMVEGLRAQGQPVTVHGLPGRFPRTDAAARSGLEAAFAAIPAGRVTLIDGLALGDAAAITERHAERLRLVALVHHPLADESGLDAAAQAALLAAERRSLAAVRGVVVTSPFTARRLQALDLYPRPAAVARPGSDPAPIAAGGDGGTPRLLCVGAVIPRKGQDVLVAALAQLRELPWRCDCIGRLDQAPGFAAEVTAAIDAAGLGGRLRLCGPVPPEALAGHYHEADLFVLPSRYEGYGMAVAEAIAHGLPVVTTDGGALAETLPAGAGVSVPAGGADALAAALAGLIRDPARRRQLADGAARARRTLPRWPEAARRFAEAVRGEAGDG